MSLTTGRGERVTPHNSYLDWLAVSLFRQWVAENTAPLLPPLPRPPQSLRSRHGQNVNGNGNNTSTNHTPQNSQQLSPLPKTPLSQPPNPNVGRVYRTLGSSPSTYLNHDECKKFLKLSPEIYSRESLKKFERRLDELKNMAREIVAPLIRSELSGEGTNTSYLVCTVVDDPRDLPWLN